MKSVQQWYYYPVPMPIDEEGNGPCYYRDMYKMMYEVWDRLHNTYGSFEYLPDAIDLAIKLNKEYWEKNIKSEEQSI